jgi:hypothetical protein
MAPTPVCILPRPEPPSKSPVFAAPKPIHYTEAHAQPRAVDANDNHSSQG